MKKKSILKINDVEYTSVYNFNTLSAFCEMHSISIADLSKMGDRIMLSQLFDLIYCSLVEGSRLENKNFDFDKKIIGTLDSNTLKPLLQSCGDELSKLAKTLKV